MTVALIDIWTFAPAEDDNSDYKWLYGWLKELQNPLGDLNALRDLFQYFDPPAMKNQKDESSDSSPIEEEKLELKNYRFQDIMMNYFLVDKIFILKVFISMKVWLIFFNEDEFYEKLREKKIFKE